MVSFYTGLPRTGKTYRAVHLDIREEFINPKSKNYNKHHFLYTNIGGLKIDELQSNLDANPIDTQDALIIKKVISLDWEKLNHHIMKMHFMALGHKSDEELLDYAKKHNLTPAKFIIDECYKFFGKKAEKHLVWWLAYHGHLGHDIVLMLQNKNLIAYDYKCFSEWFIDAQPKTLSLSNNTFRYYHYASEQYIPDQRGNQSKLKANPKTFELYKSGDKHKAEKVLWKYYIGLAIALLIAVLAFTRLINKDYGGVEKKNLHQLVNRIKIHLVKIHLVK